VQLSQQCGDQPVAGNVAVTTATTGAMVGSVGFGPGSAGCGSPAVNTTSVGLGSGTGSGVAPTEPDVAMIAANAAATPVNVTANPDLA